MTVNRDEDATSARAHTRDVNCACPANLLKYEHKLDKPGQSSDNARHTSGVFQHALVVPYLTFAFWTNGTTAHTEVELIASLGTQSHSFIAFHRINIAMRYGSVIKAGIWIFRASGGVRRSRRPTDSLENPLL